MKPAVWEYQDTVKQISHFRGYVRQYLDATVIRHACPLVRKTKRQAKKDAEHLLKKIRTTAC